MKTLTADDQKRVRIPDAKPRQVFAYENAGGKVTLTPVEPVEPRPAKVWFEKRNGRTVALTDQPINEAAIQELLAEFP